MVSPEAIMTADDDALLRNLSGKFWFIRPEFLGKWRVNALRAMANSYKPGYADFLRAALDSTEPEVRDMAEWACRKVGLA